MNPATNPSIWRLVVSAARPTKVNTVWRNPAMSRRIVKKLAKQIRDSDSRAVPQFLEWAEQEKKIANYINGLRNHIIYEQRVENWNQAAENENEKPLKYKPNKPDPIPDLEPHLFEWLVSETRLLDEKYVQAPGVPPWMNVVSKGNVSKGRDPHNLWKDPLFPWQPFSQVFSQSFRQEFFPPSTPQFDAYNLFLAVVPDKPLNKTGVRKLKAAKGHKWERDLPKRLAKIQEKMAQMDKQFKKYEKTRPKKVKLVGFERMWHLGRRQFGN